MSVELVIGGDHVKGEFRASLNINENFTPGRNINIIFRLAHVHCKKDNCEIMGNTVMFPIGDRLNNIFYGCFTSWTH